MPPYEHVDGSMKSRGRAKNRLGAGDMDALAYYYTKHCLCSHPVEHPAIVFSAALDVAAMAIVGLRYTSI